MSGPPRVRSMNQTESEERPVLGPAGNKTRSVVELRKWDSKPKTVVNKPLKSANGKNYPLQTGDLSPSSKKKLSAGAGSIFRKQQQRNQESKSILMKSNSSMTASCSSETSTDSSSRSLPSTGRRSRWSVTPKGGKRNQQCESIIAKSVSFEKDVDELHALGLNDDSVVKKRCAWVTSNTDPCYVAFHDEEWGVPVHEDKKLFELISLCIALAELSWPTILNKRQIFREVFQEFDPAAVAKLNIKKIGAPGTLASSLLSELKIRAIIENARQTCKIIEEFGSFDKYIWGFVNNKAIIGHFRYPREVPIKTSKADSISKDLIRRGFRGVGQTVVYSFMEASGITNDHLISCFRFQDCIAAASDTVAADAKGKADDVIVPNNEEIQLDTAGNGLGLTRIFDVADRFGSVRSNSDPPGEE